MFKFLFGGDTTAADNATIDRIIAGQHRAATRGSGTAAQVAAENTKTSLLSAQIEENLQLVWENEQLKKRLRETAWDYVLAAKTNYLLYAHLRDTWTPPSEEARQLVTASEKESSPMYREAKEAVRKAMKEGEGLKAFNEFAADRQKGNRSALPRFKVDFQPPSLEHNEQQKSPE